MACTRFNYDPCRTKKNLQQATGPGRWMLDVPGNGDAPAFFEDPQILLQKWGANLRTNSINLESEMIGNNKRKYSRDCLPPPPNKNGNGNSDLSNLFGIQEEPQPFFSAETAPIAYPRNSSFHTEESRVTHPAWWYRDLEQVDWYYLPIPPQTNVCLPFHAHLSTRILEKDSFTPKRECLIDNHMNSYLLPVESYEQLVKPRALPTFPNIPTLRQG